MQNLSEENMEMASVVATHIRACKECREKLNALLKVKELVSDITRPSSVRRHAEK